MKVFIRNLFSQFAVNSLKQYQLLRFLVVGTMNTGFSFGVYSFLIYLGFDFRLANLVALILGILFSFKTQGSLVFFNRDNRLLGKFVLGWSVIYFFNTGLIWNLVDHGLNFYLAGALTVPFSTGLSYLLQKRFIFQSQDLKSAKQIRILE